MVVRIMCTVLFAIALGVFLYFAWRKSERDWECIRKLYEMFDLLQ